MKKYKGLYRLLNVTMACSLAVSLSLYPVQAEEAATPGTGRDGSKRAETAAQSAPKETQAPVQAEATAEETEAAAKAEEENRPPVQKLATHLLRKARRNHLWRLRKKTKRLQVRNMRQKKRRQARIPIIPALVQKKAPRPGRGFRSGRDG